MTTKHIPDWKIEDLRIFTDRTKTQDTVYVIHLKEGIEVTATGRSLHIAKAEAMQQFAVKWHEHWLMKEASKPPEDFREMIAKEIESHLPDSKDSVFRSGLKIAAQLVRKPQPRRVPNASEAMAAFLTIRQNAAAWEHRRDFDVLERFLNEKPVIISQIKSASGNTLDEFSKTDWWYQELEEMVRKATPDSRRAMAVVDNLLSLSQAIVAGKSNELTNQPYFANDGAERVWPEEKQDEN